MGYREIQQARLQQEARDKEDVAIGVVIGMMIIQGEMGNYDAANSIYQALNEEAKGKVMEFFNSLNEGLRRFVEWCNDPLWLKASSGNGGAP